VLHADPIVLERHVMIGRRHVTSPIQQPLFVGRMPCGQAARASEDVREDASTPREVEHDQHRGPQIGRQPGDDRADGFDATSLCADHDDVVGSHTTLPAFFVPCE
jgi:hypothetical protein